MTDAELAEMERLWKGRKPAAEMARRLGYSKSTILAQAMSDRYRFPRRRAEPSDELTREIWVKRIRDGMFTAKEVSEILGVHPVTINRWLREANGGRQGRSKAL